MAAPLAKASSGSTRTIRFKRIKRANSKVRSHQSLKTIMASSSSSLSRRHQTKKVSCFDIARLARTESHQPGNLLALLVLECESTELNRSRVSAAARISERRKARYLIELVSLCFSSLISFNSSQFCHNSNELICRESVLLFNASPSSSICQFLNIKFLLFHA